MLADRLDPEKQFAEILKEVKDRGECVVDTGSIFYTLKQQALGELKKLSNILDSLDYSVLLPDRGEACLECTRERASLLSRAVDSVENGRIGEAKIALRDVPRRKEKRCSSCVEEFKKEVSPLIGYSFRLRELDFTSRPYLSSASKIRVDGEVIGTYKTPLCMVQIIEKRGVFYYDPQLPIDSLSAREKSVLGLVREAMATDLSSDASRIFDRFYRRYGVDRHKLKELLDVYVNKFGDLQYLIEDKRLTDIYVNYTGVVQVSSYDYGEMECTLRFPSRELERIASKLRILSGKPFDYSHPLASYFWEEQNCRISAAAYSGNYSGRPDFAIRLWPEKPWHILDILHRGSVNFRLAALLTAAANLGAAVVIGGDRGGGKSTLLQTFLFMIPRETRKVALLTEREIHKWFYMNDFNISEFKVHIGNKVTSFGVPVGDAVKQLLIHGESGYLIFNEIKFEEEARPFFTLSAVAGLSSLLTTMHADNVRGIVHRLMIDFQLPLTALRNIDWIVMTNMVREGISRKKRRAVTGITEVKGFRKDPLVEGKLEQLAKYDPIKKGWEMLDLPSLVESSEFLLSSGKKRGMKKEDVIELIRLFERVLRQIYKSYPVEPERFTEFMNRFFDAYELGRGEERIYKDWWRRCSRIF